MERLASLSGRQNGAEMSDGYKEFTLGPEAVDYIRDRLAEGKTLAKFLRA